MKIYLSTHNDTFKNSALDEALLFHKDIKEDILFISQNKQTISIGRNQNIYKIINHDFIEKKGITITRRLSGGGAIYQDMGTVSFSFITHNTNALLSEIIKPIVDFLKTIGLNAKCKNKKNIYVDDRKISLITQYHHDNKILYHGILLFNSDLKQLIRSLTHDDHLHQTRLTDHENNDVSNIKELLNTNWTTKTFTIQLINYYQDIGYNLYSPAPKILEAANKIWLKTSSWEWVYGSFPLFSVDNIQKYPGGTIEIKYDHINGKITKIKIFGDFNSIKDTMLIQKALENISLKNSSLTKALSPFKSSHYFGKISKKNVIDTILSINSNK